MRHKSQYLLALTLSLLLHLGTYNGLKILAPLYETKKSITPIEVVYNENFDESRPDSLQKHIGKRQFVTDPEMGALAEKARKQAEFVSRLNRRVKEEMAARKSGKTENRVQGALKASPDNQPPGEKSTRQNKMAARNESERKSPAKNLDLMPDSDISVPSLPEPGQVQKRRAGGLGHTRLGQGLTNGESTLSERIPNIKQGEFTILNTDQFTFYTFFARINEQIRQRWSQNLQHFGRTLSPAQAMSIGEKERVTKIEIVLDRSGRVIGHTIFSPSGVSGLDYAVLQAFRQAAPFMNPPAEMVESDGTIRLRYGFYVTPSPSYLATN